MNNIEKSALIGSGFAKLYSRAMKEAYYGHHEKVHLCCQYMSDEMMRACDGLHESQRRRRKRAREKIASMMDKNPIFITLTFNNETLERTTQEQRRKMVVRYLKDNCLEYVANIDFGEQHGREHYHGVCVAKTGSMPREPWEKYGNPDFKRVRRTQSVAKVANYINKFTSHAFKESTTVTGLPRLIYSRS